METPKGYYYTYYSYEEWGRGYIGSRGCKCLPEEDVKYLGSSKDKTFKPTQKIILKDDYATREEAYADEIILQQYYKVVENPHFANRAYQTSTKFYVPKELGLGVHSLTVEELSAAGKKGGKISGNRHKENKTGVCGLSLEERSENGKKGGNKNKENKTGFFGISDDEKKLALKKSHETNRRNKTGVFGIPKEKRIKNSKKAGEKNKENKIGYCGLSKEERIAAGKKGASQRWMCLETGFITNAGNLSQYQRARGIDTSKRKRIL